MPRAIASRDLLSISKNGHMDSYVATQVSRLNGVVLSGCALD